MVLGIFSKVSSAEIAISNLLEAEFAPSSLSLLTKDPNLSKKIADTSGELSSYNLVTLPTKLITLGVEKKKALLFSDRLKKGDVLLSVSGDARTEKIAAEMLTDHGAEEVTTI